MAERRAPRASRPPVAAQEAVHRRGRRTVDHPAGADRTGGSRRRDRVGRGPVRPDPEGPVRGDLDRADLGPAERDPADRAPGRRVRMGQDLAGRGRPADRDPADPNLADPNPADQGPAPTPAGGHRTADSSPAARTAGHPAADLPAVVDHRRKVHPADAIRPAGAHPGALPAGPLPVEALPAGPLPVEALPAGPLPVEALPAGPLPAGPLPVGPLPAGALPVAALPVGAHRAGAPAAARRTVGCRHSGSRRAGGCAGVGRRAGRAAGRVPGPDRRAGAHRTARAAGPRPAAARGGCVRCCSAPRHRRGDPGRRRAVPPAPSCPNRRAAAGPRSARRPAGRSGRASGAGGCSSQTILIRPGPAIQAQPERLMHGRPGYPPGRRRATVRPNPDHRP